MKNLIYGLTLVSSLFFLTSAKSLSNQDEGPGRECVDKAMSYVTAAVEAGIGDGDLNGQYFEEYIGIFKFYQKECDLGNI
jgi:hypothetical protein